jgi:uncharacterized damage-inducible protein DinB
MDPTRRDDSTPIYERPPWAQRRFSFGQPEWMLADFVERLRGLVPGLRALLEGLDEEAARRRPGGTWSIAQNAGHLADVEDLWQERLDEGGRATYTPADPARFRSAAERHVGRPLAAIVAELEQRRRRLVVDLATASRELQAASAFHERLGTPLRLVDCAQFYAEHDDHHLLRIRALRTEFEAGGG